MASNSRIKGITIELDGETTGLEKALKDVTKYSFELQGELRDVERLLKFDPGNVEALSQKQQLLTKQIENTTAKLNKLKEAQDEVERKFQSGEIGEKQYRSFRREIEYTETSIRNLNDKLKQMDTTQVTETTIQMNRLESASEDAKEDIKNLGNELVGLVAGAGVVSGIGDVIEKALDTSSVNTKIELTFDIPKESISTVKEAVNTVKSYGIDGEEALEGVRRQWALNKNATDESNASIIAAAGTIATAYSGIDFTELIQESYEIAKSFNISNEEALGLVNSLLKVGFPPDQLDIIAEYGTQLHNAGFNAQEIQAIMKAGVETGTWNIDILLDGLKEGRIVLAEFGAELDGATAELFEKVGVSSEQIESWGRAVAEGGKDGTIAMQEVAKVLSEVEDKTLQNQLGTKVFGTLWEENGTNITDTILNMNSHLTTTAENQEQLNSTVEGLNSDPAVVMNQAMLALKEALAPLLTELANIIKIVAQWVKENQTLAAIIAVIISVVGVLAGIFLSLAPIITTITTLSGILGVAFGTIAAPVLAVIAVITALIAIGVLLYKNWDEIKSKCIEVWNSIKEFFSNFWEQTKVIFSNALNSIKGFISNSFDTVKQTIINIWNSIKDFFSNIFSNILSVVKEKFTAMQNSVSDTMNSIKNVVSSIWNSVVDFFGSINLFEIGKNIIQGLVNGIKSMASSVVDGIKGVVNGAIEGAKNLLGIHSPSKLFTEFGEYTGEGFVNGINSMKKAVSKAGQDMANASIPELNINGYGNAQLSGGSNINQTVNIYSPKALTPSETARQNKRMLQELALGM